MAKSLDVKLEAVSDVVNSGQGAKIELAEPINLFPDGAPPDEPEATPAPPAPPAPPAQKTQASPPAAAQPAPAPPPAPKIETPTKSAAIPEISIAFTDSAISPGSAEIPSINIPVAPVETPPPTRSLFVKKADAATKTSLFSKKAPLPAPQEPGTKSLFMKKASAAPATPAPQEIAPTPSAPVLSFAPTENSGSNLSVSEQEAAKDLPYLFTSPGFRLPERKKEEVFEKADTSFTLTSKPPGANSAIPTTNPIASNDVATLKEYLTMREQDVQVLNVQLGYAREKLTKSEETIKHLEQKVEDFLHQLDFVKNKSSEFETLYENAGKNKELEFADLKSDLRSKIEKIRHFENKLTESEKQYENLKNRVRMDIRKIRAREKELESKLEILKRDSETLIAARENKILELKRKIDLLEFNYDTVMDQNDKEKLNTKKLEEKLVQVQKVLRIAMGMSDSASETESSPTLPETKRAS